MNVFKIKKEIEEKEIALELLIKQCEKEEEKVFLFKNNKKIDRLRKRIVALDNEIAKLQKSYDHQLEMKESAGKAMRKVAVFTKKNLLKTCIGCAVACTAYYGYLFFKPLNINGEQTTYRSMIKSYENMEVSSSDYTPETYDQYMHDLEEAEAQKNEIFLSDEEKLASIDALLASYDSLEPVPDKTALLSEINKANEYDISTYTPDSVEAFKSVISKMQVIYEDENATKKEVDDAEADITDAYLLLTLKADKTKLVELYNKYADYSPDGYTSLSVKSFNKEIQNAKELIDDENVNQDKVDKQVQEMESIETLLVKKADKTALKNLIDECNQLDKNNYKTGYDELIAVVKSSNTILSNDNVTQEEVDSAVTRLQSAKNDLSEYVTNVYRINMSARIQNNNHVGNEWSYERYCNDEAVHDGFEVSGEPGSSLLVGMKIIERDNSPDEGSENVYITLDDGYQTSFDITVIENRGRYSGNTATFTVTVTVTYLRQE